MTILHNDSVPVSGLGADVHRALQSELARLADEAVVADTTRTLDRERIRSLARLGVGAARLPAELGGAGLSLPQLYELLTEIARAESNATQILRAHFIATEEFLRDHNRGKEVRWLKKIADGAIFGNATTERGAGRAGVIATRLARVADGRWTVTGTKYYATGSAFADWIQVLAAGEDGQHYRITVDASADEVTIEDDWDGFGQRATVSGTVRLAAVEVTDEQIYALNREHDPFTDTVAQLVHVATMIGIGRRLIDDISTQIRSRVRHFSHAAGTTAATDPQVQEIIGRGVASVSVATSALAAAATRLQEYLDADRAASPEAGALLTSAHDLSAHAQVAVGPALLGLSTQVFEVGGASLLASDAGLDRHWRNLRTLASHNSATFKARALGESTLLGTDLPAVWYSGTKG